MPCSRNSSNASSRRRRPTKQNADDAEWIAPKVDRQGIQTYIWSFRDKNIGRPEPCDGEHEATFKMWSEKLGAHGGNGRQVWKDVIIKHIGETDEDGSLEEQDDMESTMIEPKIDPDFIDDVQDILFDQLTLLTKKELLADVQIGGLENSSWSPCDLEVSWTVTDTHKLHNQKPVTSSTSHEVVSQQSVDFFFNVLKNQLLHSFISASRRVTSKPVQIGLRTVGHVVHPSFARPSPSKTNLTSTTLLCSPIVAYMVT